MKFFLVLLQVISLLSATLAFVPASQRTFVSHNVLSMGTAAPTANIARKLKRKIRSAEATNFADLYTAEFDSYLKNDASAGIYENIRKTLAKKARQLKVTLKSDFGIKPKPVLPNIVQTAVSAGTFQTLVAAVKAAGLADTLSSGSFTVFAPTDEAFSKLPEGTVDGLLKDIPALTDILKYHVTSGVMKSKKVAAAKDDGVSTINDKKLGVKVDRSGEVTIEGAKLVTADIKCANGIVHVIDTVLIPK